MYLIFCVLCAILESFFGAGFDDSRWERPSWHPVYHYHYDQFGSKSRWLNEHKRTGNAVCCCKSTHALKGQTKYLFTVVDNVEGINCTEKHYDDDCFCYLSLNNVDTQKTVKNECTSSNIHIYMGIVAVIVIVALLGIIILLLRIKAGYKIDKCHMGHPSENRKSITIIRRSFIPNSNDRIGDTITRIKYDSMRNRENSHIYHSLDNLHMATDEIKINRRRPYPLPLENTKENTLEPSGNNMSNYDMPPKKHLPALLKKNFPPAPQMPTNPRMANSMARQKFPQTSIALPAPPPPPLQPKGLARGPPSCIDKTKDNDWIYEDFVNVSVYNVK